MQLPQPNLTLTDGLLRASSLNNFTEQDEWLTRNDPTWEITTRFAREIGFSDADRLRLLALTLLARAQRAEAVNMKLPPPRPNAKELRRLLEE